MSGVRMLHFVGKRLLHSFKKIQIHQYSTVATTYALACQFQT